MQLLGLFAAFVLIMVLVARRVGLEVSLLAGTAVLALTSGMPPAALAASACRGLLDPHTLQLVVSVGAITSLAGVMKSYGLLHRMVGAVTRLLGGLHLALMAVPSLVGALPVLGGAILSAPMVEGLGDRLGLSPLRKAAVNLVFRHAWFLMAPFTPALVLAAQLAKVDLGGLILRQTPLVLVMLTAGYLALLTRTGREPAAATRTRHSADGAEVSSETAAAAAAAPGEAIREFFVSTSPLVVSVALCLGVGPVRLPLWASVGVGLVLALFLSRGHRDFTGLGLPAAWAGIQWRILLAMAAVMVFGRMMTDSGAADALVTWMVNSGLPSWLLMVVMPFTVGFVSGVPSLPVGISFPALLPLAPPGHLLGSAAILYTSGFVGYFVSPLHLCQILSSQYFGVTVASLYREYWPVIAAVTACLAVRIWVVLG